MKISVGKSSYIINCEKKDEEKLLRLSQKLNNRVNDLALSLKNTDEKTLLLIAAINCEEEIENLNSNLESNVASDEKISEKDIYDAVSENMENVADYVEKLANKIKNY